MHLSIDPQRVKPRSSRAIAAKLLTSSSNMDGLTVRSSVKLTPIGNANVGQDVSDLIGSEALSHSLQERLPAARTGDSGLR